MKSRWLPPAALIALVAATTTMDSTGHLVVGALLLAFLVFWLIRRQTKTGIGLGVGPRLWVGLAVLGVASGALASTSQQVLEPLEAQVDRYLQPYVRTGNFSGSLLVARRGEVLYAKAFGHSAVDGKLPNTTRSVFHLASVSAVFTSAAIMLLEQQGELELDARLSEFLPDWPRGDEITIHHLLTQSAGFPNINTLLGYQLWQRTPQTPETLVKKFRDLPLEYAPGTRYEHSNSNYNVLALLIEQVSGLDYGEFLEQKIFRPLAMEQTAHHGDATQAYDQHATGLRPIGLAGLEEDSQIDWSVKTGNGSIHSTVEDLFLFDRAIDERSLLGEEAVRKIFTEHFPRVGYGWFVGERFESREFHMNGRSPGFGSYWGRSEDGEVTVILLANIYSSVTTPIGRDLIAMVLGEEYAETEITTARPDAELLQEIAGAYKFGPDFYRPNGTVSFNVQDGHLFSRGVWMMPAGGSRFVHRVYWSDLEFMRDDAGAINALQFDQYRGRRISGLASAIYSPLARWGLLGGAFAVSFLVAVRWWRRRRARGRSCAADPVGPTLGTSEGGAPPSVRPAGAARNRDSDLGR